MAKEENTKEHPRHHHVHLHRDTHPSKILILPTLLLLTAALAGCCLDLSVASSVHSKVSTQAEQPNTNNNNALDPSNQPNQPTESKDLSQVPEPADSPQMSSLPKKSVESSESNKPIKPQPQETKESDKPKSTTKTAADCAANRTTVEMFCPLGNVPVSKEMETKIRLILKEFDIKNDNLILEDFKEARMDHRIAATISQVIKRFFHQNFCAVVGRVMKSVEKQESDEVRMPIQKVASMNERITQLLTNLEHIKSTTTASTEEKRLFQVIQLLVHNLANAGKEALGHLKALERSLLTNHQLNTNNEMSRIRTLVLVNLVDMFFNESVMRKSSGFPATLVPDITMERCFDSKKVNANKPELEVACAFRFLFNSSVDLKELIEINFKEEEERKNRLAQQHTTGLVSSSFGQTCSSFRNDDKDKAMYEASCKLKNLIETHNECQNLHGIPHNDVHECIIHQIDTLFPEKYQNKFHVMYRGLVDKPQDPHVYQLDYFVTQLDHFCKMKNAFIAFATLDIGSYFQRTIILTLKKLMPDDAKPKLAATTASPSVGHQHTSTPTTQYRIPESIRQEYIIQSIIVYFLRAADRRMQCNINPVV